MSNNFHHRILYYENRVLIKMCCHSVTMAITKFLQSDVNRVFQEKLIYTKFVDFGEGLVTALSRYSKTCKNTYIFYGSNGCKML